MFCFHDSKTWKNFYEILFSKKIKKQKNSINKWVEKKVYFEKFPTYYLVDTYLNIKLHQKKFKKNIFPKLKILFLIYTTIKNCECNFSEIINISS